MEKLPIIFAFAPACVILGLRTYLKSYPPDASEVAVRGLLRGLKLGTASAAALPLLYIWFYFRPTGRGNLPVVVCALAGNIFNLVGVVDCLRELNGKSMFAALLLIFLQLIWIWSLFGAFMLAN
jgi:hypothetical protein